MLSISGSRGTTFIRHYISIATLVGTNNAMVVVPRARLRRLTGKVYSRVTHGRNKSGPYPASGRSGCDQSHSIVSSISSCSIRVFFTGCLLWAFHQWPTLWMQRNLLLVPSTLLCYSVVFCSELKIPSNQGCVNGILSQGYV
jgi:hypothetical protein